MSLHYMAAKLMELDEEPRDLGAFAHELQNWRDLNGSASLFLLGLYRMLLVFLRRDLGAQNTNIVTLVVAAAVYGVFFLVGLFMLHLPLMILAFASWLVHLLLSLSNIRHLMQAQAASPPAYSFGEPRDLFLLFLGRFFPRWHYCLFYEPALAVIPMCLSALLYLPLVLAPDVVHSPTPLVFFFGFHAGVLFATSWWMFREQCELEVEMETKRLEDEAIRERHDRTYEQARNSYARARQG